MSGQEAHQRELERREGERLAIDAYLVRFSVDGEVAEAAGGGGECGPAPAPARAAQHRLDAGDQLAWREGFGQVVVRADREADQLIHLIGTGRQHDDVRIGEGTELAANFQPVHLGEHQVEHDDVGRLASGQVQCRPAIVGPRHPVALLR